MVSILAWQLEMKGGQEVKSTLNDLTNAFNQARASGGNYGKEQRALAGGVNQIIRQERLHNNLMLVQHPNLLKISRGMSTLNSISRTAMSIANTLNIAKMSGNIVDIAGMEIQRDLNEAYRKRNEMLATNKMGTEEWIKNEEQINILIAQQKKNVDDVNASKFDGFIAAISSLGTMIASTFSLLIKNSTILGALTKAGGLFGGIFSASFSLASSAGVAVMDWLFPTLTGKNAMLGTGKAGGFLGGIFGTSFATGAALGLAALLIAVIVGAVDVALESITGQSYVRNITERILGKGKGISVKDILGLNDIPGMANTSGQGILGGPKSYEEYSRGFGIQPSRPQMQTPKQEIDKAFKPIIDFFNNILPKAYGENEDKLNISLSTNIPQVISKNNPIIQKGFVDMWNGVLDTTTTAGVNIVASANSIFSALVAAMNSAVLAFNNAAKSVSGGSSTGGGGFTPATYAAAGRSIPSRRAARGFSGIVNSPTMFLAGEAGAEHVEVTPNGKTRNGGGGTINNITVMGSVITERQLAYKLDQIQKQNLKSRGFTGQ